MGTIMMLQKARIDFFVLYTNILSRAKLNQVQNNHYWIVENHIAMKLQSNYSGDEPTWGKGFWRKILWKSAFETTKTNNSNNDLGYVVLIVQNDSTKETSKWQSVDIKITPVILLRARARLIEPFKKE